jgi:RHS repeat-associated protein
VHSGIALTNTYGNGFLTSIPMYSSSIKYHANGMVSEVTLGTGSTKWIQQNDPSSMTRPASISTSGVWPSNWSSGTYQYDAAGNVSAIGQDYYLYDKVSRLKFGTAQAGAASQSQTFDTFGNLTSLSPRTLTTSSTTNRLTAATNPSTTVTYDARGNVTSVDGMSYEYDALGMLRAMNNATNDWVYIYTADDERLWSYDLSANNSWWRVRDLGAKVLGEFVNVNGTWNGVTSFIYRDGVLHGSYSAQRSPTHSYYAVDHLGSPRLIVNQSGTMSGNHAYFGFGKESTNPMQDGERMKFTGHERDLCCDGMLRYTDNMHARQYAPLLGRFLSVDRIQGIPSDPQTWNRYVYARNGPMKLTDPTGDYFVLANERDRAFYTKAIAGGTKNRIARETFLKWANDPNVRITLRTARLPRTARTITYAQTIPAGPFKLDPASGDVRPSSATIVLDRTRLSSSRYPTPTISFFHELLHLDKIFSVGLKHNASFPDVNDPSTDTFGVFEEFGRAAAMNATDPDGALTQRSVDAFLHPFNFSYPGSDGLAFLFGFDGLTFIDGIQLSSTHGRFPF